MGYTHGVGIDSEYRKCTECNKILPNTIEYFGYADKKTGRLQAKCKSCNAIIGKRKREAIIERNKNKDLFYEGTKPCKKCKRDLPNNKLYFVIDLSCVSGLRNVCRECDPKAGRFLEEGYTVSKKWTDAENELLIKNYKDYEGKDLQRLFFPDRTVRAIECHAAELDIVGKSDECKKIRYEKLGQLASETHKGKTLSDETKKKLSESHKEYYRLHGSWWTGRKRSEENCRKISERVKAKGAWVGDKNPRHKNPLCGESNGRWKGGETKTYYELRSDTKDWQKSSMEFCNYKCVFTGGGFDNVHHIVSFRDIVDEAFLTNNLRENNKVKDYSDKEFEDLRNTVISLHEAYGFGACINKKVHKLFHDTYGYIDNVNPYTFMEFMKDVIDGKYNEWFHENDLNINVNYDYCNYIVNIYGQQKEVS